VRISVRGRAVQADPFPPCPHSFAYPSHPIAEAGSCQPLRSTLRLTEAHAATNADKPAIWEQDIKASVDMFNCRAKSDALAGRPGNATPRNRPAEREECVKYVKVRIFLWVALTALVSLSAYPAEDKKSKEDDFTRTFPAPVEKVYAAAVQTAASGWHLQYSDKDARALSFSTGRNMRVSSGFDMSVVCEEIAPGQTRVKLHPQRRGEQKQLFAWKEGNRIARQFLSALDEKLKRLPQNAAKPEDATVATNPGLASVIVQSTPDGADITVNGSFVGTTPSTLKLAAGDQSIEIAKPGFKVWRRAVKLNPGASITVAATLEKGK